MDIIDETDRCRMHLNNLCKLVERGHFLSVQDGRCLNDHEKAVMCRWINDGWEILADGQPVTFREFLNELKTRQIESPPEAR